MSSTNNNKKNSEIYSTTVYDHQYINPYTYSYDSMATTAINPGITVRGSISVEDTIVVNGKDLIRRLEHIEEMLLIFQQEVELEKKYPRLAKLREQYNEEVSKLKNWEHLKGNK